VEALFAALLDGEKQAQTGGAPGIAQGLGTKSAAPSAADTLPPDPATRIAQLLNSTALVSAPAVSAATKEKNAGSNDASTSDAPAKKEKKQAQANEAAAGQLLAQPAAPIPVTLASARPAGEDGAVSSIAVGKQQGAKLPEPASSKAEAADQHAKAPGISPAAVAEPGAKATAQDGKPAHSDATAASKTNAGGPARPKIENAEATIPAKTDATPAAKANPQVLAKAANIESTLAALQPVKSVAAQAAPLGQAAKGAEQAQAAPMPARPETSAKAAAPRQAAKDGGAAASIKLARPELADAKSVVAPSEAGSPKNDSADARPQGGSDNGHSHDTGKNTAAPTQQSPAQSAPQPAQFQITHGTQGADAPPAAQAAASVQTSSTPVQANLVVMPHADSSAAQQPVPVSDLGQIALSIAQQSQAGTKHFDIALHPADLGSIHVHLSVDQTGAAQAHLSADNHHTLELLQRDSGDLQRSLRDAGLNLAGGSLSFSLKGQQQQAGGRNMRSGGRALSVGAVAQTATSSTANQNYSLAAGNARLDIRV
jgi:flagellar hook-length control protein FliK